MDPDTIEVRLLGGFSIAFGDRALQTLPPQAVSLLSFLIVNRDRPQTRDLLAGRFWADLSEDKARKRLSNTLWQIKKGAKDAGIPPLLHNSSTAIQIADGLPLSVDFEEFEAQLTELERELRTRQVRGVLADRLADLVSGYPGEFLSGHYHDWIDAVRDRITGHYNGALAQLVQLYKSRSQYDVALRFASISVEQEPLREDLRREVMRLHAMLGQPHSAERQFADCAKVLREELKVEPSAETVELMERIRSDAPTDVSRNQPATSDARPLVGRSQELSVLLGRADELLSGSGGVVLVEGDPGIGKTRLIEEFVDAAEWRGIRVLSAGHTGLSNLRPYETLRAALRTSVTGLRGEHLAEVVESVWLQQAAEVFPELSRLVDGAHPAPALRPEEEPTRMGEALARVILAQGGLGPTMIVLEDIHWCDEDSMQVLSQLGSRLARSGVLLCLTYRRFEAEQSDLVWGGISQLEALPSGTRLVVSPLRGQEVRELISTHLGPAGLSGATVTQLVAETNGNPLYVLEAVRNPGALNPSGKDEERLLLGGLDLPASVIRSVESRTKALQGETLAVIRALATLSEPASAQTLADIVGVARKDALRALTQLADRGFVADDDDGICRFFHEQTRRVVYELTPPDARREIHRMIYLALSAAEQRRPEQLAHHAAEAGRMHEARQWYLEAAREALAINAYRTAADHFGQADEAGQELGIPLAERARDLLSYEVVLDVLGRRTEQAMLLKRLREVSLPLPVELELVEREVWLLLNTDEQDAAAKLAVEYAVKASAAGEPNIGLLIGIAVARYRSGDFSGAVGPARRALAAATDVADVIAAETVLGKALVDLTDYEEGEQHLTDAAGNASRAGDDRAKIEAVSYQAVARFRLGRFDDAEELFTGALRMSEAIGYRWGEGANLGNLGTLNTAQGRGGQALANFDAARDVFGSLGNGRGEAFVKTNAADLYHRLLGDDDTAMELASSAAVYFRSVGDQPTETFAMSVVSSIDRRRGQRRLARRRLNDLLGRAAATGDVIGEAEVRRVLAYLEVDIEDWRSAATQLDRILRLAEGDAPESSLPEVLALRAHVALKEMQLSESRRFVDRALALSTAGAKDAHITAWYCGSTLRELEDEGAAAQFGRAYELLTTSLRGLPAEVVERSWQAVPAHGWIADDYRRHFPVARVMAIPHRTSPMGRPLTAEEFVEVRWTVSEPADWDIENIGERRKARLIRLVSQSEAQGGAVRVSDLASVLDVSERTIKRDIAELRATGTALRTRKSS